MCVCVIFVIHKATVACLLTSIALSQKMQNKAQQRLSGRGRRGSSRFKLESDI